MKFGQLLIGILVGLMFGSGLSAYFMQRKSASGDTKKSAVKGISTPKNWSWPDSLDAVVAAPDNHKIVFEDSTIRILQVVLAGNKEEPIHTHKWRSIMWITKPAVPCIIYQYDRDKKGTFVATDSITVPHMEINTGFPNPAEGPTGIKNLSNDNGIAYRIEFKKDFKL
jgi:hypothetical protein